jgi:oligosaccharide repeat unit polymerase
MILFNFFWPSLLALLFAFLFNLKLDFVGATFALVVFLNAILLSTTLSRLANLLTVYFIFSFLFLGLIPWLHYSEHYLVWRSVPLDGLVYITANLFIFIASLTVFIFYHLFPYKYFRKTTIVRENFYHLRAKSFTLLIMSAIGFIGIFYAVNFSIVQLAFRGLAFQDDIVSAEASPIGQIFIMASRLTPVFCFFYALTEIPKRRVLKIVLFCFVLMSVFPTGVARYMVAFTYIPILMLFFSTMRRADVLAALLLLSIAIVFPFLNQFRYFSGIANLQLLPKAEFFFAGHFDAYENLASAIDSHFVTYGYQLIGVFLFFVPRSFWPDKPVGSGFEMAERSNYGFGNISMPFLGEGYVNFGYIGIIVFAAIIGLVMAWLDRGAVAELNRRKRMSYPTAVYFFVIGALFFVLRGDLLSSVAYTVSGLTVAKLVGWVMGSFRFLKV